MTASQLSEEFVKSHSTTDVLRSAWCDATIALIKRILSDVLKIQCEETTSDEVSSKTGESSSSSKDDGSISVTDTGGSEDKCEPMEVSPSKNEGCRDGEDHATSMETDSNVNDDNVKNIESASNIESCTPVVKDSTSLPDISIDRGNSGSDLGSVTGKHPLEEGGDDLEESSPRKKMKLDDETGSKPADDDGAESKPTTNDEVTSVDVEDTSRLDSEESNKGMLSSMSVALQQKSKFICNFGQNRSV